MQKKTILLIFVECVLCEFLSYDNDQVVKTHLIYQEKIMARTRNTRVHFRERYTHSKSAPIVEKSCKILKKCYFQCILMLRAVRAEVRTRAYNYEKWKVYHLRILFNIYIMHVALILSEITCLEIWKVFEKRQKSEFFDKNWRFLFTRWVLLRDPVYFSKYRR